LIHIYGAFAGGRSDLQIQLDLVKPLLEVEGTTIWVDLEEPTDEEIERVGNYFGFHPLSIEDAIHYVELPKIDEFEDYVFIISHGMRFDEGGSLEKIELDSFIGRGYLVTSHQRPSRSVAAVREHVRRDPQILARGADFLLHEILDRQVDNLLPVLDGFDEEIDRIEELVFERPRPALLEDILALRRHVIALRRSIGPQRDVLGRLARRDLPFISVRASIYFRDVYDHVARVHQMLEEYRDITLGLLESYRSMGAQRLGEIMQRLTAISTVFLPITFIASIFGMNFDPFPGLKWAFGYLAAFALMAVTAVGFYAYFKWRQWI